MTDTFRHWRCSRRAKTFDLIVTVCYIDYDYILHRLLTGEIHGFLVFLN